MALTLDTKEYEFCHGKKPRGHGYWGFSFPYGPRHLQGKVVWFTGTLAECKKQICREYPFIKTAQVKP